ncbi:MarR family winged helix-turn-helix transcriptional regulator [Roseibium aestuarii]|uniref:MarR family winged helix-turn-helix transcriptional regulator n=1 Tax=Roseibium aestuarii TaxID=2600299 RepID=A0ABW4JXK0_9HYPH
MTAAEPELQDAAPSDLACAPASGVSRSVALDQFLCFSLYSANHAMTRVYRPLLQSLGLTYPQYLAMVVLWEKNDQLVGDIGARLHLESNTMTPLLKRLESLGLVSRERSQKDERQVRVKLTRKGHALKQKTNDFASCILAASGISVDALIDLQQRISELRDNLLESQSPDRG